MDEIQAGLLRVRLGHLEELAKEKEHICKRYINELTDETIISTLSRLMECDGYGAVYALTLLYFTSHGAYPIYDKYAHIALIMILSGRKFNTIITESDRKREFDFDSRDGKRVFKYYKAYISKLNEVFGAEWKRDRNIDRALWSYGHLFSDNATNRLNRTVWA